MPQARTLGRRQGVVRVAIADDSALIYSDDYRDGWAWGFQQLGVEVQVFDVSILRKVGGLAASPYRSNALPITVKAVADQIAAFRPDLLWCHHGRATSNQIFLDRVRRYGTMTAVYLCDEPYEVGETALYSPFFDHVFSMDPCTIETHQLARGGRGSVWYLPPGVNTERFKRKPYEGRTKPVVFLGNTSLVPRPLWLEPVRAAVPGADIRYGIVVHAGHHVPVAKGHPDWIPLDAHPEHYGSCILGLNVHRSPWMDQKCLETRVRTRAVRKPVPAGATLCQTPTEFGTGMWNDLNLPAGHVNPRFFEMAACGTCVVSDNTRFELERLFKLAPRADTPEHFVEIVRYYLDHPTEAEAIGHQCSYLISTRHTYRHRAAEVMVRTGLMDASEVAQSCYLGPPVDWLSIQDFSWLKGTSSSDLTGLCGSWSPALGMSLTKTFGVVNADF